MELLPFASPTSYYNDNTNIDNEDESVIPVCLLELKRQFKLITQRSPRNDIALVNSQRTIPISLTSLTEQLNRYKSITDGLLLNTDQIYCMILALILGEYHTP
jgi:hypothetical protein